MKQIRSAALQRHNAPPFGALDGLEVVSLRRLPCWVRWLYFELRMLSDFKSGHVQTSWAVLAALMDCDKGGKGGPAPFVPSVQQLRRAVADLEALRLVERSGTVNERSRTLYLRVLPITTLGAPALKSDSSCDRPRKAKKPKQDRANSTTGQGDSTAVATGDSVPVFISPKGSESADLSTGQRPTLFAREVLAGQKPRRGRESSAPPAGGSPSPASRARPPGPASAQADAGTTDRRRAAARRPNTADQDEGAGAAATGTATAGPQRGAKGPGKGAAPPAPEKSRHGPGIQAA